MAVRELDLDQAADEVILAVERGLKDFGKLRSQPESTTLLALASLMSSPRIEETSNHRRTRFRSTTGQVNTILGKSQKS